LVVAFGSVLDTERIRGSIERPSEGDGPASVDRLVRETASGSTSWGRNGVGDGVGDGVGENDGDGVGDGDGEGVGDTVGEGVGGSCGASELYVEGNVGVV
jgi:hypothetical protein